MACWNIYPINLILTINEKVNPMNNTLTRLPCRGCLPSFKYYASCEGMPWRLPVEVGESEENHERKDNAQGEEK